MSDMKQYQALLEEFHDICKKQYPRVRYPEMVWLFDQVLHIDPRDVAEHPITKKTYRVMLTNADGTRLVHNGRVVKALRKFTPEQRKIVNEWWPLLPVDMRDEG